VKQDEAGFRRYERSTKGERMTRMRKGILVGIAGTLVGLAATALLVILTGAYNVAATERHQAPVAWALEAAMRNSVQAGARELHPPATFTPAMIAAGAGEYKTMCQHCHGGVGTEKAGWAAVMTPDPPALARAAEDWTAAEVFWLVKHGVKMTGMPAFGPTHDDETLWNIAAFVKALPEMSAEKYAAYPSDHGMAEGGHVDAEGAPPHEH
jgi:mono/diheme cytochrome c family protein